MTTRRPDDRDEATEDEIRAALARLDDVPQPVLERARNARAGVAPAGSCLLEIVYDSVLDPLLGHFDREESVRLMSFAGDGLRLDLRLEGDASAVTLSGWTAPDRARTVVLVREPESENTSTALAVGADGTFQAQQIARSHSTAHSGRRRWRFASFAQQLVQMLNRVLARYIERIDCEA